RSPLFELVNGSVVHDIVRRSGNISIHVIAGEAAKADPVPPKTVATAPDRSAFELLPYIVGVLATGTALALALLVEPYLGVENADLILLTAIVAVAVRSGLGPSLVAVLAASLSYNFFFLPPVYTLTIADPTNIAAFLLFTVVAVVVSNLASRS
ncbi:DUF4118 domain-containing protein, partial [Escherichia coli]|uniref:DUF4118 domain-containing protein n=1 Tax=Escherichia coli TaxID=562 RepID=UPI0011CC73C2